MAEDHFDSFRLSVMQDLLPVGLAMFDRARKGGAGKVVEVFTNSTDPFSKLKEEGEASARSVRDKLDQVSPGLGNPVVSVEVNIDEIHNSADDIEDEKDLVHVLSRIEEHLDLLGAYIDDRDSSDSKI